ncbi:MAG TPA: hypothetical protein VG944_10060 [Fimbriimonas sp.]|nr:hypothetical protein [Fimbriimonas sp.]
MFGLFALATAHVGDSLALVLGHDVGIRIVQGNQEVVPELLAKDASGDWKTILVAPTDPMIKPLGKGAGPTGLAAGGSGLFQAPPTLGFGSFKVQGDTVTLVGDSRHATIRQVYTIPNEGKEIQVDLQADMKDASPRIQYFLASYNFAPGTPDTTWAPALRKLDDQVIGDHFFRSPGVVVQKGSLSAVLMPDLDVLADNRPIPTILDLDCNKSVTEQPLLSYGFADYRLVSHVAFSHDASMVKAVPPNLHLAYQIRLNANTAPHSAYEAVVDDMWQRYGHKYYGKTLPQAMPYADYAKVCYPAAIGEKMTGGWFETTIDGHVCGGLPAGWGLDQGWVSWQDWFNQLRSAWGLRWFGKKQNNADWVDKADKMLNLALAAPMKEGACPTTYDSKKKEWRGSLITPAKDCYYDLTNIAWKGISMLRWLQFSDCPRRADIEKQLADMAGLMMRFQNPDGSIPTWLDTNLKVVPVLDRSAQSALPIWFLAEWAKTQSNPAKAQQAVKKGADFLLKEVVDPQRYYDYETFFSCSPKQCLQRNMKIDDKAMWDPYTQQAPQNTMCMQWTAEALKAASELGDKDRMMAGAMKALDTMCLYQVVWPISYRRVAYTYGGFGVQNSDGEYNDARQAQFAETLCDFAVKLNRQDLFERGVAAARASLTLINHPLHEKLGIYPNPNYPLGLEPENDGHGGSDEQDGRTGFDWGEGSGLSAIATLLDRYGSNYTHEGWSVLVDGVPEGTCPAPRDAEIKPEENPSFDLSNWRMPGWIFDGDFLHWAIASNRSDFGNDGKPFIGTCETGFGSYDDNYTGTITSPPFTVSRPKMKLLVGGGQGPGEYVELIDENGKQLFAERGHNSETMDERTWDLAGLQGKVLRLRIVDKEKEGWGHINVGAIRLTD